MTLFTMMTLAQLFACGNKTDVERPATSTEAASEEVPQTQSESKDKTERIEIAELEHFGPDFTLTETIPAGTVLSNPEQYVGQTVRVTGKVSDVCQKMGCWMVITDADQHMRITTKDHKFFVAKDGAGAKCDLEGTVVKREANPERTAHYKSEQTDGAPMPEAELAGQATYEIVASAVEFDRSEMPTTEEATESAPTSVE